MLKSMNLVRYGRLLQNRLKLKKSLSLFLLGAFFQPLFDGAIEKAQVEIAHWKQSVGGGAEPVFMLPFSI